MWFVLLKVVARCQIRGCRHGSELHLIRQKLLFAELLMLREGEELSAKQTSAVCDEVCNLHGPKVDVPGFVLYLVARMTIKGFCIMQSRSTPRNLCQHFGFVN